MYAPMKSEISNEIVFVLYMSKVYSLSNKNNGSENFFFFFFLPGCILQLGKILKNSLKIK